MKRAGVSAATLFFAALSLFLAIVLYLKTRPTPRVAPSREAPGAMGSKRRETRSATSEAESAKRETKGAPRDSLRAPSPEIRVPAPAALPRLAVLVDDLGNDQAAVERIASWRFPVTTAVLPALPGSELAARVLENRGKEVLLHLPMEPRGYPGVRPGPGVVLTSQSEQEIARVVESDLASVPGAVGVNNHMGSLATADRRVMDSVADVLARRGLFFVDSRTTEATVARDAAEQAGVRSASRRVFLDDVPDAEAIRRQLDEAVARARADGSAIAIGHPHTTTLSVLEREMPRLEAEIRLVPVSQLVK